MPKAAKPMPERPDEDRVETPNGTVCLVHLSSESVRVVSGRDVGWFRLRGATVYATAMFGRDGDSWTLDPRHSTVTTVVDDKAGPPADPDTREEAWNLLTETFLAWREARPDIPARFDLFLRQVEERKVEERIESLRDHLKELQDSLPSVRKATTDAEARVEAVRAAMADSPAPRA